MVGLQKFGVSIDGSFAHNYNRVDWAGEPTFSKAMRGIELLKRNGIKFDLISVVAKRTLDRLGGELAAKEVYSFLRDVDPYLAGINIEDTTGDNKSGIDGGSEAVNSFWLTLANEWKNDPRIRIREIDIPLSWLQFVAQVEDATQSQYDMRIELLPTIGWDGSVCLFSPEFLTIGAPERSQFIVGNLNEHQFMDIMENSHNHKYFTDFLSSVSLCRNKCPFFAICRGGKPSYRYFEHGQIADIMETEHCKSQIISPTNALISSF